MKKYAKYTAPTVSAYTINLENTLAQGSTNITFGGNNSSYTPEIEDWEDTNTNTSGGFTL